MEKSDLNYSYPDHLVATERKPVSRVMLVQNGEPQEVTTQYVLTQIQPDDVLVVNETKVIPARVVSESGLEILFINNIKANQWQVLCPVRKWKGDKQILPGGVELTLVEKGRPQLVEANKSLAHEYFFEHGDMPLPPYIQEARGERRSRPADLENYQTQWASELGSLAAPTASLHFSNDDLEKVKARGSDVLKVCLHVGLGTFLPIYSENLDEHVMHEESVSLPESVWSQIQETKKQGGKVWALGSTVTRALESKALRCHEANQCHPEEKLKDLNDVDRFQTDLFIRPGFDYKVVDVLMTNFHQPESTLIAMVMAFSGVETLKKNYQWAIERNFRLFSYGDLSVWMK